MRKLLPMTFLQSWTKQDGYGGAVCCAGVRKVKRGGQGSPGIFRDNPVICVPGVQ